MLAMAALCSTVGETSNLINIDIFFSKLLRGANNNRQFMVCCSLSTVTTNGNLRWEDIMPKWSRVNMTRIMIIKIQLCMHTRATISFNIWCDTNWKQNVRNHFRCECIELQLTHLYSDHNVRSNSNHTHWFEREERHKNFTILAISIELYCRGRPSLNNKSTNWMIFFLFFFCMVCAVSVMGNGQEFWMRIIALKTAIALQNSKF